jgi:hypothetical protein
MTEPGNSSVPMAKKSLDGDIVRYPSEIPEWICAPIMARACDPDMQYMKWAEVVDEATILRAWRDLRTSSTTLLPHI